MKFFYTGVLRTSVTVNYTYYVIGKINSMPDYCAVKSAQSSDMILGNSPLFNFDLEDTSTLYVGRELIKGLRVGDDHAYLYVINNKIEFFLSQYRTKINKEIYKIQALEAIKTLAFGCKHIIISPPLTLENLDKALFTETKKQNSIKQPSEIVDSNSIKRIKHDYNNLNNLWLNYWHDTFTELLNFYQSNKEPLKSNYYRNGLSSLINGKFDEKAYKKDFSDFYETLKNLIHRLAFNSKRLPTQFYSDCPLECGRNLLFFVSFSSDSKTEYYYLKDDFPFGIYKQLSSVCGSCPACGSFIITQKNDPNNIDNLTCIFKNEFDEHILYVIMRIIYKMNNHISKDIKLHH